jgi:hypothetical protein
MLSYLIELDGASAGFGSIAISGPWKDKPTLKEFYLLPDFRTRAFELFDAFRAVSRPGFIEIESSDTLLFALACTYARNLATESIVFHDYAVTHLPAHGAVLRCKTGRDETARAIQERQGGSRIRTRAIWQRLCERRLPVSLQPAVLRHLHGSE